MKAQEKLSGGCEEDDSYVSREREYQTFQLTSSL
jgi:hypothetical protein